MNSKDNLPSVTTTPPATFTTPLGKDIRVVMVEGEPWFVAADVCAILDLGWDKTNNLYAPSRVMRHLDANERGSKQLANQGQTKLIISESGLYKLTMRSDKPQAKVFQNWVTREVLPAIRKEAGQGVN